MWSDGFNLGVATPTQFMCSDYVSVSSPSTCANYVGTTIPPWDENLAQAALKFSLPQTGSVLSTADLHLKVMDRSGSPTATVTLTDDNNWIQTTSSATSKFPTLSAAQVLLNSSSVSSTGWISLTLPTSALDAKIVPSGPTDATLILTGSTAPSTYFSFVADDDGSGDKAYLALTFKPQVQSVSVPANATYTAGDALNFTVTFDSTVHVTGFPKLPLILNTGGVVYATYVSGDGSKNLMFRYTVASGDADADGLAVASALVGGTIRSGNNDDAELTLYSVTATTGVLVDGVAPTISGGVTAPSANTYGIGGNLDYTATFSENVVVNTTGGTPYLTLAVGGSTVHATYLSGSGTNTIKFRYTVISGDVDADGVALASNVTLNGGTIKDAAGNPATLTFTGGTAASVLVDARPSQTITFGTLASQTYGTAFVKLTATASSSLPVSYASANPAAVSISNDTAYLLAADTATITASQSGGASYLAATSVSQKMTVAKKLLTIAGAAASNKVYDNAVSASVTGATLSGKVGADDVTLVLGTAVFATKDTGTAKAVTVTGSTLSGTKAGNYSLTEIAGLVADITAYPITVTADAKGKIAGTSDPVFTYTATPLLGVDTWNSGTLTRDAGEAVGDYPIRLGTLSAGGNYAITFVGANLSITQTSALAVRPVQKSISHELGANTGKVFAIASQRLEDGRLESAVCKDDNSCLAVDVLLPGASRVSVAIYDNLGTPVIAFDKDVSKSDYQSLAPSGDGRRILSVSWNLHAKGGAAVEPGVYLWRIVVQGADGQKLETVKRLGVKRQ